MKKVINAIEKIEKMDISGLEPFQGELKLMSEPQKNALRNQILKTGFSFAFHVWQNKNAINIIDGHQRWSVLTDLKEEGYEIPKIECVFIKASSRKQAKERVLQAVSQYGKIQKKGLIEFVEDFDFEFKDNFDLPDFKDVESLFKPVDIYGDDVDYSEESGKTSGIYPLVPYYGGKQKMAHKIVPYIPKHLNYIEPFCGGCALLFLKPTPNLPQTEYREFINDRDERIINLYRVFQGHFDEIEHLLKNTLYSESEHAKAIEILENFTSDKFDNIRKAWAYYVSIRQSFSKILNSAWAVSLIPTRNHGDTWAGKITGLTQYRERMSKIMIFNRDALKMIKACDAPHSFFYCDPPYPGANQGHYGGYTKKDFDDLMDLVSKCQGTAIVSNYDQGDYSGFKKFYFKARMTASRKLKNEKCRTEVLYVKQKSARPSDEAIKMYNSGALDCFQGDRFNDGYE